MTEPNRLNKLKMKTEILLQNYSLHFGPQTEERTTVHTYDEIEINDMYNDNVISRKHLRNGTA